MLSPILFLFGLLAVLTYYLYGGPQHKDRLQVLLSALACTLVMAAIFDMPSQPRLGSAVADASPINAPPSPELVHVAKIDREKIDTAKIDPELLHARTSTLDCKSPLQPAEMHSSGCAGGCVGYNSTPENVCSYAGPNECNGNIKQKIRRYVATNYSSNYLKRLVSDDGRTPEFRWPASGRILQAFSTHGDGINIALPEGTPIKAAEEGYVAFAGSELKGYGNLVMIRHPNGFVTAYAHNSELVVIRGDVVKRGQMIAKSGMTGAVDAPQLHFELRKGSMPVDPTLYLPKRG